MNLLIKHTVGLARKNGNPSETRKQRIREAKGAERRGKFTETDRYFPSSMFPRLSGQEFPFLWRMQLSARNIANRHDTLVFTHFLWHLS